jgi:hypothetical protein
MADHDSDRDHQQPPIDPSRIPQTTALELQDPRFLIAEQLLTPEALPIGPDQLQDGAVATIPEPYLPKPTAVSAGQTQQPGPHSLSALQSRESR